jgi:hypothetical protein
MKLSFIEYSTLNSEQLGRLTPFRNLQGIVIPPRTGFAVAVDSSNGYYLGVVTSRNGEQGYERNNKETILVRTCETFLACKPIRGEYDIVAKLE